MGRSNVAVLTGDDFSKIVLGIIFSGNGGAQTHFANQNKFFPKTPPPVALSRKIFKVRCGTKWKNFCSSSNLDG